MRIISESRYIVTFAVLLIFMTSCQNSVENYNKNNPIDTSGDNDSNKEKYVTQKDLETIYTRIKTPYKYGLVLTSGDSIKQVDSPSVFYFNNQWYMTYIIYDGKTGYETWIAKSENLLDWITLGKIMSYSSYTWDSVQKAGYFSLIDFNWGGKYEPLKYNNKYWMSYLGGNVSGYESGILKIGIAYNSEPNILGEWNYLNSPVLSPGDHDARWFENVTIYKSTIIYDELKLTGYPFVMYYNAKGDKSNPTTKSPERIGMAVSKDMINWKRYLDDPVIDNYKGISGDAQIAKIDNIYVMFYFQAVYEESKTVAFDTFACSYDLVNWTKWNGEQLIKSSETYDAKYAHKPCVIFHNQIVYHFFNAVDAQNRRGIALATSTDIGKSKKNF